MQGARHRQRKARNRRIERGAVVRQHLITALHGAYWRIEHGAGGVLEGFTRCQMRMFAHHTGAAHFLDLAVAMGDDPVPGQQLRGYGPIVADGDRVGKGITPLGRLRLFGQKARSGGDIDGVGRNGFHAAIVVSLRLASNHSLCMADIIKAGHWKTEMTQRDYTLIGAGLAGSLLALLLARRGARVRVFERRADPRSVGYLGGRSINLALAERGLHGLRLAGLEREVMAQATMMRGRMVHEGLEAPRFMRYGVDDSEVIWSVNRGRLNLSVLEAAEDAGAQFHFDAALEEVDFERGELQMVDAVGARRHARFDSLIGSDGAGSALRAAMLKVTDLGERTEWLGHSYKELEIPAADGGGFRIEPNALHIWPRGGYMLIALPNVDGSFTVTLFLANEGTPSFARLDSPEAVRDFFANEFPGAVALMPEHLQDFTNNPTGLLATLRLDRWHLDRRALLIGDAAHAIVPFHGQGMNCAFEDCVELDELLSEHNDLESVFEQFTARRKPNADATADMAIENYIEMRDSVADDRFVLLKQLERELANRHPDRFVPRYTQVMFRRIPYAEAQRRGRVQWQLLEDLLGNANSLDGIDFNHAAKCIKIELDTL